MNFVFDNLESSISANIEAEIQVIRNVTISRYFTAAGLAIILYDTILTMEDEVSVFSGWAHEQLICTHTHHALTHSLSGGSTSLARAFRSSEAALLPQPIPNDCVLDRWQLSWVQGAPRNHLSDLSLILRKTWLGSFDSRFQPL